MTTKKLKVHLKDGSTKLGYENGEHILIGKAEYVFNHDTLTLVLKGKAKASLQNSLPYQIRLHEDEKRIVWRWGTLKAQTPKAIVEKALQAHLIYLKDTQKALEKRVRSCRSQLNIDTKRFEAFWK